MILFCDSSALVKLYVLEQASEAVAAEATASEAIAVCRITWVECMAALARRARERSVDAAAMELARQRLATDWPRYQVVEINEDLTRVAGDYADTFALRAHDAVQLGSVQLLNRELPGQILFACYDSRLVRAARVLGIASM